jgi:hypothetical protein
MQTANKEEQKKLIQLQFGSYIPLEIKSDFEKAAEGDADAQFEVASYFLQDQPADRFQRMAQIRYMEHGYYFLTLAAAQNHPRATNQLGIFHGNLKHYELSQHWFRRAAELGFSPANVNLGRIYEHGEGVEQDLEKAFHYYLASAETSSNSKKPTNLGDLYAKGIVVPKDAAKAFYYYLTAANQGQAYAKEKVGKYYYYGIGVNQSKEQALLYFLEAGDLGRASSQNAAACLLTKFRQDPQKAAGYLQQASNQNFPYAHMNIAKLYETGLGFYAKNPTKAAEYYKKITKQPKSTGKVEHQILPKPLPPASLQFARKNTNLLSEVESSSSGLGFIS